MVKERLRAFVIGSALLAGCSGAKNSLPVNSSPPLINSFSASPISLPAGGGTVTLSWQVDGATSITIDSGVGDVTSASNKTVSVTSSTTFTLTARNSAGAQGAETAVAVGGSVIDVSGLVLQANRLPAAALSVAVSGGSAITTDSNGRFTAHSVTTPYDVALTSTDLNVGVVYRGLTRPDPTLLFLESSSNQTSTVAGTVSGGRFPQPEQHQTLVGISGAGKGSVGARVDGTYVFSPLKWSGPGTTATVHAIQFRIDSNGFPVEYVGYGMRGGVTLRDGASLSNQDVVLSPVSSGTLSGAFSLPPGYSVSRKQLDLMLEGLPTVVLATDTSASSSFSYLAPSIGGSPLSLSVTAMDSTGESVIGYKSGLLAASTGLNLQLPPAPILSSPIPPTQITLTTPFSWTGSNGQIYLIEFGSTDSTKPSYTVILAGTNATLPDLTAQGLGLPMAVIYQWQVIAVSPFATVDGAAGSPGLIEALAESNTVETYIGTSASSQFQTRF